MIELKERSFVRCSPSRHKAVGKEKGQVRRGAALMNALVKKKKEHTAILGENIPRS
jgi:hypothetical protein